MDQGKRPRFSLICYRSPSARQPKAIEPRARHASRDSPPTGPTRARRWEDDRVTDLEAAPALILAADAPAPAGIEILEPRDVPLGGPRAMTVHRTLPQRRRSLIGAWCFLDSYGPDDVAASGGMHVPGHPHTGLQTVTWLFEGEVEHRDTLGTLRVIRPGEVNLMTAGAGIAHSEYSTPRTTRLH